MLTQLQTNLELIHSEIMEKLIPENIKKDVEILNVTGTYEGSGGGDTILDVGNNNVSVSSTTLIFGSEVE